MTDAERDLLLALAKAVLVGTHPPPYDYASSDELSRAWHAIRKAREEVEHEVEARRADIVALLATLEGACKPQPADGMSGEGSLLGSAKPAVQCPSCGRPSCPEPRRGWSFPL